MEIKRWAGIVATVAVAAFAGGCAVYSTPSGEVIGPAPVVVSPPPVVVTPFYWGHSHYHYRHPPRYYNYRQPGPRYYGRPYYRY